MAEIAYNSLSARMDVQMPDRYVLSSLAPFPCQRLLRPPPVHPSRVHRAFFGPFCLANATRTSGHPSSPFDSAAAARRMPQRSSTISASSRPQANSTVAPASLSAAWASRWTPMGAAVHGDDVRDPGADSEVLHDQSLDAQARAAIRHMKCEHASRGGRQQGVRTRRAE
jgi:hypothetical protein